MSTLFTVRPDSKTLGIRVGTYYCDATEKSIPAIVADGFLGGINYIPVELLPEARREWKRRGSVTIKYGYVPRDRKVLIQQPGNFARNGYAVCLFQAPTLEVYGCSTILRGKIFTRSEQLALAVVPSGEKFEVVLSKGFLTCNSPRQKLFYSKQPNELRFIHERIH